MTSARVASRSASVASVAGGVGAVLLPKCPVCFAAYASALGALGVGPVAGRWVVDLALVLAVTMSTGFVLALAVRRRDVITPLASAVGAALILTGRLLVDQPVMTIEGAALLVAGALVNSARCRKATPP